jgi:hypothetical protein
MRHRRRFIMIDEPEPRRDMSSEERPGATADADTWNERRPDQASLDW